MIEIETNTLKILLKLKSEMDKGNTVRCTWSATGRNPNQAFFTYKNNYGNVIALGKIFDFNIQSLPTITFDDVYELDNYINNNHYVLTKLEKMKIFL